MPMHVADAAAPAAVARLTRARWAEWLAARRLEAASETETDAATLRLIRAEDAVEAAEATARRILTGEFLRRTAAGPGR